MENKQNTFKIINGDCLEVMKTMPDNSVDSIVTDPPYGLSFMGKAWDKGVPSSEVWKEAIRVLKPGGHLLAFAGTRTQHRMATAIEDAGFEIRDMIAWVYGSGFPKSRNVGLDIDKINGVTGNRGKAFVVAGQSGQKDKDTGGELPSGSNTIGAYVAQNEFSGWGTALKPALEPITVARKPFKGTVAQNVLEHGTGAINIDGCRVGEESGKKWDKPRGGIWSTDSEAKGKLIDSGVGRFPANFIHDGGHEVQDILKDSARFFYCPKANRKDRNEGLEEFESKGKVFNGQSTESTEFKDGSVEDKFTTAPQKNHHPTVKPTDLMAYLCRLVTPKGGTVLDPFNGSGSTGKAAMREGFSYIGIELDPEYVAISEARIAVVSKSANDEQWKQKVLF